MREARARLRDGKERRNAARDRAAGLHTTAATGNRPGVGGRR